MSGPTDFDALPPYDPNWRTNLRHAMVDDLIAERDALRAEVEALRAVVQRVRDLHVEEIVTCQACEETWPCSTLAILDGAS